MMFPHNLYERASLEKENDHAEFIPIKIGLKQKIKHSKDVTLAFLCDYFNLFFKKIFLGAFGTVYLAQRLSDDREVILKQIPGIQMTLPILSSGRI